MGPLKYSKAKLHTLFDMNLASITCRQVRLQRAIRSHLDIDQIGINGPQYGGFHPGHDQRGWRVQGDKSVTQHQRGLDLFCVTVRLVLLQQNHGELSHVTDSLI